MAIYGKTTRQMLVDLINEGNPDLPFPINDTDFDFTMPEVIADPGNGHNTRVRVIAKAGTNYIGNILVTYRRLTISTIFRNMILELEHWVPNTGANGNVISNVYSLLPLFSEKFGLNFEANDQCWNNQNLTGNHGVGGSTFNITAHANNWAYIGSVQARWLVGERTLESLLPNDIVAGRQYPGGNDLDNPEHKYYVTPDGFDRDYTEYKNFMESSSIASGVNGAVSQMIGISMNSLDTFGRSFMSTVLNSIRNRAGDFYLANMDSSHHAGSSPNGYLNLPFSLNGTYARRYALPHAAVPEANAEFYNRVVVIELPEDCPWGTGKLFLHYNV